MKSIVLILVFVFTCSLVQAQFVVSADYRIRGELKNGYRQLNHSTTSPAFTTTQRTRLNLNFTHEKLQVCFAIQDIRTWGEVKHISDVPSIDIHQAYVKYSFNDMLAVKLGRQEVKYDKKRLLGLKNWNNVSVSHDIGIIQFSNNKIKLDAGFAHNNDSDKRFGSTYGVSYYKQLGFIWLGFDLTDDINLSIMNIYDGNEKATNYQKIYARFTSGFLGTMKFGPLDLTASSYFQYGESPTGQRTSAYFFHLKPEIKVMDALKLGVGLDYFSGDKDSDDNKLNSFSNLYGDGHGYYGHMDYFTNVPKHTKDGGLNDAYFQATLKASNKVSLIATLHNFRFTTNVSDSVDFNNDGINEWKTLNKQLGTEIDAQVKYKFYKNSTLAIGYSTMIAATSMEYLKGGDHENLQHWAWISIQFKPELFNSKNLKKMEE